MNVFQDPILQAGAIFFIFLAIFFSLTQKNISSKKSPKTKRLIQYVMFLLIFMLIIWIFQNHSSEYIKQNS